MVLAMRMEKREILRTRAELTGNTQQRKVIVIEASIYTGITEEQILF